jgi:hypothetical protein
MTKDKLERFYVIPIIVKFQLHKTIIENKLVCQACSAKCQFHNFFSLCHAQEK